MPRVSVNLSDAQYAAIAEKSTIGIGPYIARLVEADTGLESIDSSPGLARLTPEQRTKIGARAAAARWEKAGKDRGKSTSKKS